MQPTRLLLSALFALALLSGCAERDAEDFCGVHANEHWRHANLAARLDLNYNGRGEITALLDLPLTAVSGGSGNAADEQLLHSPANVLSVQQGGECTALMTGSERQGDRLQTRYRLDCGEDFKLDGLSVPMLERVAALDEVDVNVATPAVSKHFLIHRHCERALFNVTQATESP